jgi:hypothetical protein
MAPEVNRRDFLAQLGITVGTAAAGVTATAAAVGAIPVPLLGARAAHAQGAVKGNVPDTPY